MTDSHETVRAHVLVSGRVQGVGFRAFTYRQAHAHGLAGWVRNLTDGRVETEVQGSRFRVDCFLEDLRCGPSLSSVEHIDLYWVELGREETDFEVLY